MKIFKVPQYKQIPKAIKSLKESFDLDDIFDDGSDEDQDQQLVSKSAISSKGSFIDNKVKTLVWLFQNSLIPSDEFEINNKTDLFLKLKDLFGDEDEELDGETLDGRALSFSLFKNSDGRCILDWNGSLLINSRRIYTFPNFFIFRYIKGDFNASNNFLRSMKGFPTRIEGNCVCSFNFIKNFDYAPKYVGGTFEGSKQKVKTEIPLNDENYRKFINGDSIMENRVMIQNKKGTRFYGEVTNINEGIAYVNLDNGSKVKVNENDLNLLDKSLKNLL